MNINRIIKPQKLQPGDTVGIVSPSEPIIKSLMPQFDAGKKVLEDMGLKVKISKHAFDQFYYNAGTRQARIEDFNEMWNDPEVKMILMSHGGETANHLLDGIDYKMIRRNPKIFAGISDGTTLLNAIFAKSGIVTYHGPDLIWTFGRRMTPQIKENMIKTFFDGNVGQLYSNPNWGHQVNSKIKYGGWKCIREGKASGVLVGGHSGCLSSIIIAGYAPNFKDKILFLEGTDDVAHLDRQFTALRLNGVFDQIKGLIIGWFEDSQLKDKNKTRPVRDVVKEATKDYSFPILEINELGHNVENYVLPIGCKATIDSGKKYFSIDEKTVI